ncbi:Hsp33 family molecular chaperone HslO [Sulfoacidibacillus thermotolerans]|uniref:33 kDa chaperonin n=1 Tax=Sulfoacidibacillus thermotolerans TaxID=1765684 RepID=A0A2U3DB05_SULT2|nr:Hsp33 family molecular chaperone HslO [Sulfoacidibacillus thermotolerans]PWI58463.1 Hsp33 family molecular chaperone [Sulfoacidibacillus thermotolerans]
MSNVQDYVIVATGREGRVLAYAAVTRSLVDELQRRHDTWPVVTAALGRVATMGALFTPTLKHEHHQVTLQIQGNGPAGKIVVVATGEGTVRGYVEHPHIDLPLNSAGKLDVGGAVGHEGALYVVKDLGLREPYRGHVPLVSGEIGEDFAYYFAASEQVPSAVAVGVLVAPDLSVLAAGGFVIQMLPEATPSDIAYVEEQVAQLPQVTSLLHEGDKPEDLLRRVLGDDMKVLARRPLIFACTCSKERLGRVLLSLGKQELTEILEEQGQAELICHFCNAKYLFDHEELMHLRDEAK